MVDTSAAARCLDSRNCYILAKYCNNKVLLFIAQCIADIACSEQTMNQLFTDLLQQLHFALKRLNLPKHKEKPCNILPYGYECLRLKCISANNAIIEKVHPLKVEQ